jgi:hypothetical protein
MVLKMIQFQRSENLHQNSSNDECDSSDEDFK